MMGLYESDTSISIQAAGSFAICYLKDLTRSGPVMGQIHSVYNKTINVSLKNQLLAIQSKGSPISPLSLISSASEAELKSMRISAGMMVLFLREQDSLMIRIPEAGQRFSLTGSCRVSETLLKGRIALGDDAKESAKASLSELLRGILSSHTANSLDLLFSDPKAADDYLYVKAAGMRLEAARKAYQQGNIKDAAETLCRLVGLGIGLTPSGDDFLCGLLASIYLFGDEETEYSRVLLSSLSAHLSDTHDISRAFLVLAMQGEFSEAVCTLAATVFRHILKQNFDAKKAEPWSDSVIAELSGMFQKIGHSSGFDTLAGMLFYLSLYI